MLTKRVDKLKGLLHPGPHEATVARYLPSERFTPFVEHYWIARWHVPVGSTTVSELTYPSVQLVVECCHSSVTSYVAGVITGRFTKHLEADGFVLGIKFRPGGFYPVSRTSAAALTDRRVPLRDLFGAAASRLEQRVGQARDDTELVRLAEAFLAAILPAADEGTALVSEIVDWICANRTDTQVIGVARQFGLSLRALQRLFHKYVGVSPKWVMQRYRLLEAVEELPSHGDGEIGQLAADLGYFDQAHFAKDFKSTIGSAPADYARRFDRS